MLSKTNSTVIFHISFVCFLTECVILHGRYNLLLKATFQFLFNPMERSTKFYGSMTIPYFVGASFFSIFLIAMWVPSSEISGITTC